jgi:HD superfamily phosphodiesterase
MFAVLMVLWLRPPATNLIGLAISTLLIALTAYRRLHFSINRVMTWTALYIYMAYLSGMGLSVVYAHLIGETIGEQFYGRLPWFKSLFNKALTVLCLICAHLMFTTVGGKPGVVDTFFWLAAILFVLTFFWVNMFLVAGAMSLERQHPFFATVRRLTQPVALPYMVLGFLGIGITALWQAYSWLGLAFGMALVLMVFQLISYSVNQTRGTKSQLETTIRVLVSALEYRDPYTHGHSGRVAKYARMIGQELRLPAEDLERIELAGWLHDVGKVGIPDHILNKETNLTDEEFAKVKEHPVIGHAIISQAPGMEDVAMVARHHHQHYGGGPRSYPDAITGEDLSLIARIMAVADAYDAMTSDRPYRPALSRESAITELKRNAWTQFDPRLIEMFLRVLEREDLGSPDLPGARGPEPRGTKQAG